MARVRPAVFVGLVALAVRLAIILAVPAGYAGDVRGWMKAAQVVATSGIHAGYSTGLGAALYPPGFFYPLWLTGQTYRLCCSPQFELETRALDVLVRLGPVLVDAMVVVLVYLLARRFTEERAVWAGLAYALNPAVLTAVAWMGMVGDSYYVLAISLSLLAAISGSWPLAFAFLAAGVLTKPQALAFVPLIGFLACTRLGRWPIAKACAAGLGVVLLTLLPFLWRGGLSELIGAVPRMGRVFPFMHVYADNLWYIAGVVRGQVGTLPPGDLELFLELVTYRDIGLLAFGSLCLLVMYWLLGRSGARSTVAAASLVALGFFTLSTRMHVNYTFPAFALLSVMATAKDYRYKVVLLALTAGSTSNWLVDLQRGQQLVSSPAPLLSLLSAAVTVIAFAILLAAVGATIGEEPRDRFLLARQVDLLRLTKWPLLVAGGATLVGCAAYLLVLGPGSIPSALRTLSVFGVAAMLVGVTVAKLPGRAR